MPRVEPDSFEDPSVKRLCCKAWSEERAPDYLRAQLAERLAEEAAASIRPPAAFWQRPFAGVAAAAVVLLASGAVLFQTGSLQSSAQAAITPQLAGNLVTRHDLCCSGHGSHQLPGVPMNNLPMLGQALSQKLHEPVLAANLPEGGWTLRGGSICPVGQTPAAHIIFQHGAANVSVFSMAKDANEHDGRYQAVVNHHAVAGFVDSRGVFCLVSSGDDSITAAHLADLRDRMQSDVVMTAEPAELIERETVAELLH